MPETEKTFAELTTTRVGGPAKKLLIARERDDLISLAKEAMADGEPYMFLGGGSNTLMRDEGFDGTVVLIRNTGVEVISDDDLDPGFGRLRVQAGHNWDELVVESERLGFSGLEPLSGIPGLVGAAPIQNIGAYGAEIKDFLHSIELLEEDTGEIRRVTNEELEFSYRNSLLKMRELLGLVVSVDLVLPRLVTSSGSALVKYEQLARALGTQTGQLQPVQKIREKVLQLRSQKGMVLNPADPDTFSTGSFFMNPIVSESFARALPKNAPRFEIESDEREALVLPLEHAHLVEDRKIDTPKPRQVKLSAAWLIENAGLQKGFSLPGSAARISTKHTLAITNTGYATAEEIAELARFVVSRVRSEFGVLLVPEPNLYGLEV